MALGTKRAWEIGRVSTIAKLCSRPDHAVSPIGNAIESFEEALAQRNREQERVSGNPVQLRNSEVVFHVVPNEPQSEPLLVSGTDSDDDEGGFENEEQHSATTTTFYSAFISDSASYTSILAEQE